MRPIAAGDLMTPDVLFVEDDMPISDLAAFLVENEISGAAVKDRNGDLVGVVSMVDIAAATAERGQIRRRRSDPDFYLRGWEETLDEEDLVELRLEGSELSVRDIMNPAIYSVTEDTPVPEVAQTMLDGHLHRLLVTRDREVVGIISTSDLLGLLIDDEI